MDINLDFNATLLAQMFHFILTLIILRLVAYKPLMNVIEQRQKYVADNIAAAENQKAEAEKFRAQYEADLAAARDEAKAIVERANKAAKEQAAGIIQSAKDEAVKAKESALADIQREKEKAVVELRDQVASLAVLVAGKVIKDGLTVDEHHNLVQDAVKEVGQLQ